MSQKEEFEPKIAVFLCNWYAYAEADSAEGVLVAERHLPSDCHYISGNFKALRRVKLLKRTLEQFGIELECVRLE